MATFTGAKILARYKILVVDKATGKFLKPVPFPKGEPLSMQSGLANVYYKTNLPLNKHFRHQKCLFRGRFVMYYRAT